ncbi:hypothetical protein B4U84_26090 [Westiellopsis prolifica IICB1]|nr:hypothetical protein B4U84_26090 [Westiellopsis prolifica IICB1]
MEKPLIIDLTKEDASLQILPSIPRLSSSKVGWHGIGLEYHRQPAHTAPEHCPAQHVVVIHHQPLAKVKRQLNGCDRVERIGSGDIVVCPANVSHFACWEAEVQFTLLFLESALIAHTAYEFIDPDRVEILPHFAQPDPLIYQIGLALKSQLESNEWDSKLYAESAASMLAVHLLQHYSARKHTIREYTGSLPKYKLRQVVDYINAHLDQNLDLTELALLVQMSHYHFVRLFKQSAGITPYQYLIKCRLEKVKSLLVNTDLSMAEIAKRTGFSSHSHLTRLFCKHLSVTPREYRQMQLCCCPKFEQDDESIRKNV